MKPKSAPYLLWLDLETTGLFPDADIIEVAYALTDQTTRFASREVGNYIVTPSADRFLGMDEYVRNMHLANGLANAVMHRSSVSIRSVERDILARLDGYLEGLPVPLAGSGVHFDHQFIERDMPELAKRLTYWHYDVGVLRRFFRIAGAPYVHQDNVAHRALNDVYDAIDEARQYMEYISARETTTA